MNSFVHHWSPMCPLALTLETDWPFAMSKKPFGPPCHALVESSLLPSVLLNRRSIKAGVIYITEVHGSRFQKSAAIDAVFISQYHYDEVRRLS